MLSMCVLALTEPLRRIDLALSSTIFSIYIPPKHHTDKDHSISNISPKYPYMQDHTHWLAKSFKPLTEEEKRQKRIKFLKKQKETNLEGLAKTMHQLRQIREDIEYDVFEKYDNDYEPIVEGIMRPMAKATRLRIKHKTKVYMQRMREKYQEKKASLLKFLNPPKYLTDEEVEQKVALIKESVRIRDQNALIANAFGSGTRPPWTEDVSEEEANRRLNFRDSLLVMYRDKEPEGSNATAQIIDCYEDLCFRVTRRVEGWEPEEEEEEEGEGGASESEFDILNANMQNMENETEEQAEARMAREAQLEAVEEEVDDEAKREKKEQDKLLAFEKAQQDKAAASGLSPAEAEKDMHAKFRRLKRQRLKDGYDADVVDLLDKICIAVDLSEEFEEPAADLMEQIEDDYDMEAGKAETASEPDLEEGDLEVAAAAGEGSESEWETDTDVSEEGIVEEEDENALRGCEISFMIFVNDDDRKAEGLAELEAEDIGVMLRDQVFDMKSKLRSGFIGNTVLDSQYKLPYKKRTFDDWESFWVHVIHPTFFYRSTKKSVKGEKGKNKDGRLASGLLMHNPTSEFSELSKDTFLMLSRRYGKKKPTARPTKKTGKQEELDPVAIARMKAMEEKAKKKAEANKSVVNLQVDEFADDVKKLAIVRPNFDKIDKKTVERLRRIAEAFKEKYEMEMAAGLEQPGDMLRQDQYVIMIIRGLISLEDFYSILLLSYSISSGALGCPNLLLSYSMMTFVLHNTIILIIIITHLSSPTIQVHCLKGARRRLSNIH